MQRMLLSFVIHSWHGIQSKDLAQTQSLPVYLTSNLLVQL